LHLVGSFVLLNLIDDARSNKNQICIILKLTNRIEKNGSRFAIRSLDGIPDLMYVVGK